MDSGIRCPEAAEHAAKQMKVETDLNCKFVYDLLGRQQMRNVRGRRQAGGINFM